MERKQLLQTNIRANYAFFFLTCLRPSNGVWMIYLAANGFSLLELGLLEGIFHIASFLGEVPTGAVADLKGRAASRKLGRVFYVLATLFVMSAFSYTIIVIGFILYAISYNLESGAGDAFIYDSLLEVKREDEFKTITGRLESLYQSANVFGLLIGGALALTSYTLLYVFEALISIAALWTAFWFTEPAYEKSTITTDESNGLIARTTASLRQQVHAAIKTIRARPIVSLLILHSAACLTIILMMFYYLQIFWKERGLNEFEIGVIFTLGCVAAACCSLLAPALERLVKKEILLRVIPALLIGTLLMLSLEISMPLAYVLASATEGVLMVVVQDWLNSHIPSAERATVLSFQSMCFSVCMILLFPLFGFVSQVGSISLAFSGLTAIFAMLTAGFLVWLNRSSV